MSLDIVLVIALSLGMLGSVTAQDCSDPDVCKECPKFSCLEGSTLVPGEFCGCCPGCGKPPKEPELTCSPDFCDRASCFFPECSNEQILAKGSTLCHCCGECVTPRKGGICYSDFNTGEPTCGDKLSCHHGICG